ncbi:holin [Halobacillus sp. A1]|uniref:Holin n=1 Tax=Halobacillus campisalis TaxID=435909 RepID=A0ABW2K127_9BACI|nr:MULTISPECIES: holin [Halobacillus]MCP3032248.1 holin [Halobacillus sp. A1]
MQQVLLFATILCPFVTGSVEVMKRTINLPKNYLPLISAGTGLVIGALAYPLTDMDLALRLWAGAGAGLSGTGLFEVMNRSQGFTKRSKNGSDCGSDKNDLDQ